MSDTPATPPEVIVPATPAAPTPVIFWRRWLIALGAWLDARWEAFSLRTFVTHHVKTLVVLGFVFTLVVLMRIGADVAQPHVESFLGFHSANRCAVDLSTVPVMPAAPKGKLVLKPVKVRHPRPVASLGYFN